MGRCHSQRIPQNRRRVFVNGSISTGKNPVHKLSAQPRAHAPIHIVVLPAKVAAGIGGHAGSVDENVQLADFTLSPFESGDNRGTACNERVLSNDIFFSCTWGYRSGIWGDSV